MTLICSLLFVLQIQEWLCLNCQTQRAVSGQLGDMGKMPPVSSGSKASPVPAPAEPTTQKTPAGTHVKGKKKETEVKTETEKLIPEKETPSIEKTPPTATTDQKLEESKLDKGKVSTRQEKKPPSEKEQPPIEDKTGKKPPAEEKSAPAEEKPPLEGKKPAPEEKRLPPEEKPLAAEGEEKRDILEAHVDIPEEPAGRVAAKTAEKEGQPEVRTADLPLDAPQTLPKAGEKESPAVKPPQVEGGAKSDQGEPGKEKTVSILPTITVLNMQVTGLLST